jgi:hypothetical protein
MNNKIFDNTSQDVKSKCLPKALMYKDTKYQSELRNILMMKLFKGNSWAPVPYFWVPHP